MSVDPRFEDTARFGAETARTQEEERLVDMPYGMFNRVCGDVDSGDHRRRRHLYVLA